MIRLIEFYKKLRQTHEPNTITEKQDKRITSNAYMVEKLQERNEYLLSEMQHRIGNNLSITRALVRFYLSENHVSEKKTINIIDDLFETIILLNEQFFAKFYSQSIEINETFLRIIQELCTKYSFYSHRFTYALPRKTEHIDKALPLAMFFTLLISNSIRKLLPEENSTIIVSSTTHDESKEISICFHGTSHSLEELINMDSSERDIIDVLLNQAGAKLFFENSVDKLLIVY